MGSLLLLVSFHPCLAQELPGRKVLAEVGHHLYLLAADGEEDSLVEEGHLLRYLQGTQCLHTLLCWVLQFFITI